MMEEKIHKALYSSTDLLLDQLVSWYSSVVRSLPNILVAAIVLALFLVAARFFARFTRRVLDRHGPNSAIHGLVAQAVFVVWFLIGTFIALGVLDLQKTVMSLLAGAGVVGLVLGVAFQDIAGNFFAGVLISLRRPYELGDEIQMGTDAGIVMAINLRNTVVRGFDGVQLLFPNRKMIGDKVLNRTRYGTNRITVRINVSREDDLRRLKPLLIAEIQKIPTVLPTPPVSIDFADFSDNGVEFNLRAWIPYTRTNAPMRESRDEIVLRALEVIRQNGFHLPYPKQVQLLDEPQPQAAKENVVASPTANHDA